PALRAAEFEPQHFCQGMHSPDSARTWSIAAAWSTSNPPPEPIVDSQTPSKSANERTADYWATDHKSDKPLSWLDHPVLLRNAYRRVTGDANLPGLRWFQNKYLGQRVELALSLGCGLGGFERGGIQTNIARAFHAHDISPGAIATAKA